MSHTDALTTPQRRVLADVQAGRPIPVGLALTARALERRGLIARANRLRPWRATAAGAAIATGEPE